jgi:hypothetical protein
VSQEEKLRKEIGWNPQEAFAPRTVSAKHDSRNDIDSECSEKRSLKSSIGVVQTENSNLQKKIESLLIGNDR